MTEGASCEVPRSSEQRRSERYSSSSRSKKFVGSDDAVRGQLLEEVRLQAGALERREQLARAGRAARPRPAASRRRCPAA